RKSMFCSRGSMTTCQHGMSCAVRYFAAPLSANTGQPASAICLTSGNVLPNDGPPPTIRQGTSPVGDDATHGISRCALIATCAKITSSGVLHSASILTFSRNSLTSAKQANDTKVLVSLTTLMRGQNWPSFSRHHLASLTVKCSDLPSSIGPNSS